MLCTNSGSGVRIAIRTRTSCVDFDWEDDGLKLEVT